jgi:hypothetical protein
MKGPKARFAMFPSYRYLLLVAAAVYAAWRMWRGWRQIRDGGRFTPDEQTVLGFQMLVTVPILLLGFAWFLPPLPYLTGLAIGLAIGVLLFFIALTSIVYRVTIVGFRRRGRRGEPQRGGNAIAAGIVLLCIMLVTILLTGALPQP